jgi:glycosyltransferase involved in cell wall biosynthesis/uncharacterized protein YciW
MARGLPVLVTRHSGHLDFCNDENSFLIDCTYEFSDSHLKVFNSYWARPSIDQLVQTMKTMYRAGRSPETEAASKASQGERDALRLRWCDAAERVDGFVEYLDKRPVMRRKLRVGWISTYNARCGIAAYSEHLLEFFDNSAYEITILADDQTTIGPDPDNILRLWSKSRGGLSHISEHLIGNRFDAAFFQYNFSFFDFADFADTLIYLSNAGVTTFVTLHRTGGLQDYRQMAPYQKIIEALQSCARLFVHGLEDVNRLREFGVSENVVLLTHGVIDRVPLNKDAARSLLGLSAFAPVIGTSGFLLPGKGLAELIHSFALVLRAHPAAYLLMLNADYPTPESQAQREHCLALVHQLDLRDHVSLLHDFLDIEEILFLLSACDVVVYPYQRSEESASGAVRLGLAAGRPVLTTPLPTFSDLSEIVYQLPGTEARAIAEGIISFLGDEEHNAEVLQRQRDWVRANSWAAQSARISNILDGCFEEIHGIELRPPRVPASEFMPPAKGGNPAQFKLSAAPSEDLAAAQELLERKAVKWWSADSSPQSVKETRRFLAAFGSSSLSLADRARDLRDWQSAVRYYREALEEKPNHPAIWVQYGHALKESGNRLEAENAYRKSIELDGDIADTHLQLGHVLKIQGKRSEASAAYLRAFVLDPELHDAAFELKGLGWTRGRIELALRRARSGSE